MSIASQQVFLLKGKTVSQHKASKVETNFFYSVVKLGMVVKCANTTDDNGQQTASPDITSMLTIQQPC